MGVFRATTVLSLMLPVIFQTTSFAQMQSSEEQAASQNAAQPDYYSTIDQLYLDDMRSAMLKIWGHGLNPKTYWTDDMEWAYQRGGSFSKDLKYRANQSFLQLLQDLYSGSVDPQLLGFDVKFIKKNFISVQQLQALVLASGKRADSVIEGVAPQNPPYLSVKEAMRKVYPACTNGAWTPIVPVKKDLKLNTRNKVLIDIKKRLSFLGYRISSMDDLFDGEVLAAINDIQWNLRAKPDGVISPGGRTWTFLNVSCMDRVRQLQADMEKMRWLPQQFEPRYIFINLAMTYFALVDRTPNQNVTMSFRTINGRPARKSPTMRDEVVTVIFNPYWVVPPTIFMQDKVEEIKNLPPWEINNYFNSHNYEVWNKSFTKRIDPSTIDWWGISEGTVAPDIYIRQKPHLGNALGGVKFELTNSFSVYMHDTNQRELFVEPMRQLSSGCIRLEKPFDLAEYILQGTPWNRAAIDAVVAKPGEIVAKPTIVPLKKDRYIPVYLAYLTSQMSSDGIIRFADDLYGQNTTIQRYISGPF
ncbi:L,D-transpeptidase family protein [Bdellovibrio svalbardensis]|uniref:L,D-transpeptidase family protein n=1 Tax=Bdellovibrio svalbardensis TaxID=2972972 RepID=A0ABT6DJM0_9BACT|nr:L,D-transpeptidase family protein [Bdellovibrio svalbardensis]MDG0816988.1 L,D-transpeptidase family protein [Bdellovibrio svalbardensis]